MRAARLRRPLATLALVGLVAAGCATEAEQADPPTTTTTPAAPTTDPPDAGDGPTVLPVEQDLSWGPCTDVPDPSPGVGGSVECAVLQVRMVHDDPDSEVLDIAVVRRPATRFDSEGVIIVNPGGPGGSGVASVARNAGSVPEELRARYDVIGFDPRGAHRSGDIRCVPDEEFHRYLDAVDPLPEDPAAIARYQELVEGFERACAEQHGDLLRYVGVRFVARDVEALRIALGVDQINWFGYSYGTLMGTVYAQEFPESVRTLVLDGPVVTDIPFDEAARIDLDGFERIFRRFAEACDARPDCPLAPHGGTLPALEAVIDRVIAGGLDGYYQVGDFVAPTGSPGDWTLSEGRIGYALISSVYQEASWPVLEEALAAVLDEDWGGQLRYLADFYLSGFEMPPEGTVGEQRFWALRCADRQAELEVATIEEGLELEQEVLGDPYAGRPRWLSAWRLPNVWCLRGVWPEPAERLGSARVDPADAPPAIVFGATGDFATPIEYLEPLAEAVGGGHVVRVDSNTHVNMATNECQQDLTIAFVHDPTGPPDRDAC